MSTTTLIVNATPNPNESEALDYYSKYAGAILKEYGGKLIEKYTIFQTITDKKLETNIMIMEFNDNTIIEALDKGENYQKLIPYRDKAFTQISINFANKS